MGQIYPEDCGAVICWTMQRRWLRASRPNPGGRPKPRLRSATCRLYTTRPHHGVAAGPKTQLRPSPCVRAGLECPVCPGIRLSWTGV